MPLDSRTRDLLCGDSPAAVPAHQVHPACGRAKRWLDVAGSLALLAVLAIPMVVIWVLVRVTSRGPVLYRQERVGRRGQIFLMLKFRTMRVDAEAKTGPVWSRPNDPRRTWVGAILRRLSLDELPQLINVLRGDMSLVGPRPERPYFVAQFERELADYGLRHQVRPGLTGWAQIHGLRGDTSLALRLRYDLEYVREWSLARDFVILLRTPLFVLGGAHAH